MKRVLTQRNLCKIAVPFFIALAMQLHASETKSTHITHGNEYFNRTAVVANFKIDVTGITPRYPSKAMSYTSASIENAFPFNAVGAHWQAETPPGSEIEVYLRFSDDGEHWGRWLYIPPDEEPVAELTEDGRPNPFAGDVVGALAYTNANSRFVQYRLDFAGNGEAVPVVRRFSVQIINSTDGPEIDEILQAKSAGGERVRKSMGKVLKPVLVKRAEWGAQAPRYAYTYTMVGHIAFHHTAGVSDYDVSTKDDCAARVRAIQSYHRNTLGWNDIGYAYAICKLGHIFQGREDDNDSNDVRGAHDAHNTGSQGVANLGYFHAPYNHQPTPELLNALYRLLAWKCDERAIDPQGRSLYVAYGGVVDHIYGHQEVRATACPGDLLFPLKQTIKDSVQKIIEDITTSIAEDSGEPPNEFRIIEAFPNPLILNAEEGFARIRLNFQQLQPQTVKFEVYNMLGQLVRVLYDGLISGGNLELQWDGKNAEGQLLPAGVYFYRLATPDRVELAKVLFLTR